MAEECDEDAGDRLVMFVTTLEVKRGSPRPDPCRPSSQPCQQPVESSLDVGRNYISAWALSYDARIKQHSFSLSDGVH